MIESGGFRGEAATECISDPAPERARPSPAIQEKDLRRQLLRSICDLVLSENLNPRSMIENESGKSREFLSLTISILTLSGYNRPTSFGAIQFSDRPDLNLRNQPLIQPFSWFQ